MMKSSFINIASFLSMSCLSSFEIDSTNKHRKCCIRILNTLELHEKFSFSFLLLNGEGVLFV